MLSDGTLLASLEHDELTAIDLETNAELWRFPPEEGGDDLRLLGLYGTPVVSEGRVFLTAYDGSLYALDLETGELEWFQETGRHIVGGAAVAGDTVYVGSGDHCLYAFDSAGGDPRWEPFCSGDKIWSTPVVSNGVVYVASMDKRLYALNADTGTEEWSFKGEAAITSTPVVAGDRVYVGALNNKFYALDAASGEPVWSFSGDNWFWNRAVVTEEAVYVGDLGGQVYALDISSGEPRWEEPFKAKGAVRAAAVLVEGMLVVADGDGYMYGLDADTGAEAWSVTAGSGVAADLLAAGDIVYVSTKDGDVLALDPSDGGMSKVVASQ